MKEMKLSSRRLLKTGNSKAVTLPKHWLEHYSLQDGSELALCLTEEGWLQIRPAEDEE